MNFQSDYGALKIVPVLADGSPAAAAEATANPVGGRMMFVARPHTGGQLLLIAPAGQYMVNVHAHGQPAERGVSQPQQIAPGLVKVWQVEIK